ncbi:MAG: energy transducer TonB [Saprospiraceae bacterium]|nr:energy transducer TonB [Saprospiraceae bacterium]
MIDISVGSATLGLIFLAVALIVLGIIIAIKRIFASRAQVFAEKQPEKTAFEGRNKYAEVDVFKLSGTFFNVGLALTLGLVVVAFGWTQYERQIYIPAYDMMTDADFDIVPPRIPPPPTPPPTLPPPVIEVVPENLLKDEQPEFQDISIDANSVVEAPITMKKEVGAPPVLPAQADEGPEEIVVFAEEMPRFLNKDCENLLTIAEKKACADKKLFEFIHKNIKYPPIARENGIEGTAFVTFVVEKDGKVTDAKIVREPGGQLGQEALRVINLMNEQGLLWEPGKQRGRKVRVQFSMPVKFVLEN